MIRTAVCLVSVPPRIVYTIDTVGQLSIKDINMKVI